jgi:hypothetical protein
MRKIDQILHVLPATLKAFQMLFGERLDYSPESLKVLERVINETYPPDRDNKPELIAMLGVYLGEVFVRNIPNATWVDFDEYVDDAAVTIEIKNIHNKIFPLKRMFNFFKDRDYKLYPYYKMIEEMTDKLNQAKTEEDLKNVLLGTYNTNGEWRPLNNKEFHFRTLSVDIDKLPKDVQERVVKGKINIDEVKKYM